MRPKRVLGMWHREKSAKTIDGLGRLNGITKITLNVLETNEKAIALYKKLGFEIEGTLRNDKILSDGKYYNTIVMGRCID